MADRADDRTRELEAETAVLRTLLAAAPAFISRITIDGRFLYVNRLAPGFRREDVIGAHVSSFLTPVVCERLAESIRRAIETRETQSFEGPGPTSLETVGRYVTRVSPIVEDNEVTSLVMVAADVTDLAQTRDQLRESRTQLQLALDATGMGIWTYDPILDRGTWDSNARRIFGVEEGADAPDLLGLLRSMIHPDDRERVSAAIEGGLRSGSYGPIEHRIVTPTGIVRWIAAWGTSVAGRDGPPRLLGSVVDVTERRAADARALEAEKLESVARLAGGIAHDFNNMLTAVNVNVELLLRSSPDDRHRAMLREIRHAADRSAALTKQLLAFARRQLIDPKVVDANQLVERVEALLRRVLGASVETSTRLDARRHVRVDPAQLEQVLINLATNARDAMPEGGQLVLETSDVTLDEAAAERMQLTPGAYVRIVVRDSGSGIAPEVLPHVFEPFYSTRPGGTGLGLATCHGIAKQSFGHIGITSAPGAGTTVELHLPAHTGPSDRAQPAARPRLEGGQGECILVAEDEDLVRTVLARTLESGGYRVRAVSGPHEAIDAFEDGKFDLLVTDVVMPGMDGRQLARRLTEQSPSLPVLLISGYSDAILQSEQALEPGMRFLQKPFSSETLLGTVRELLDTNEGAAESTR